MSFHGALFGFTAFTILYCKRRHESPLTWLDRIAPVTPIGLFFGRIANFINDELYGRATDVPWAVTFPSGGYVPRHPSQIYEAVLEGLILFLILLVATTRYNSLQKKGLNTALFLIGYGAARFFVEFFREPDGFIWILTKGQAYSLPMVAVGFYFLRKKA